MEVEDEGNEGITRSTGNITAEVEGTPRCLTMSTLTSIMAFFLYEPGARTSDRRLGSPWWKKLASLSQGCEQELLIADCRWELLLAPYLLLARWVWRYVRLMSARGRPAIPKQEICQAPTRLPRDGLGVLLALGF